MRDPDVARRRRAPTGGPRLPALPVKRGPVKPAPPLAEKLTADARANGPTICQVDRAVAGRIDRLAKRLRAQLGVSVQLLPRAAMLRALLLRGLDTAEPQGLLIPSTPPRFATRYEFALTAIEIDRVERFRASRWSRSTHPPMERLLGALARRALPLAELDVGFAKEALASLLLPAKAKL